MTPTLTSIRPPTVLSAFNQYFTPPSCAPALSLSCVSVCPACISPVKFFFSFLCICLWDTYLYTSCKGRWSTPVVQQTGRRKYDVMNQAPSCSCCLCNITNTICTTNMLLDLSLHNITAVITMTLLTVGSSSHPHHYRKLKIEISHLSFHTKADKRKAAVGNNALILVYRSNYN